MEKTAKNPVVTPVDNDPVKQPVVPHRKNSIFTNKKLHRALKILTGLSFLLFIAYQILMTFLIEETRTGRIIGISCYVLITVSSFLAIGHKFWVSVMRNVLMVAGLSLLFFVKLLNIQPLFEVLDFAYTVTVLNCAVLVLSELGTALLVIFYLAIRGRAKKRRTSVIMMSVIILIFAACLVMECILLIKYRVNIDTSLKLTFISRFFYFFGFTGTAIVFCLPHKRPKRRHRKHATKMRKPDEEIQYVV